MVKKNLFSENFDFGGFTIELRLQKYGFNQLKGLSLNEEEVSGTHGSFYLFNSYEDLKLHKITFGDIAYRKLKAKIKYSLNYHNWKESRGIIEVDLQIEPIVLSNQVVEPIDKNRNMAVSIVENYIDVKDLNLDANISVLNGFRFEYKTE